VSRYQAAFIAFCLALLCAGAGLAFWVGPVATGIAFDGAARDAPYYLLQFLRRDEPDFRAQTPAQAAFRNDVAAFAAVDGGSLVWSATTLHRHEARARHGSARHAFATLDVLAFERGAGVVQMLTNTDYRARRADAGDSVLLAGVSVPPESFDAGAVSVLILYESMRDPVGVPTSGDDVRDSDDLRGWFAALGAHGGSVAWRGDLAWFQSPQAWNRFAVLQFADTRAVSGWLRDPVTRAGRALASRDLGDLLVLVSVPEASAPASSDPPESGSAGVVSVRPRA
jgi:hypothetical protein